MHQTTRTVAILGLGSRGLSVLERLVSLASLRPRVRVHVHVVDPAADGEGLHTLEQPDYLLLNTTCGQVSMFPDAHTVGDLPALSGPSLHAWAQERGLRMGEDGFTVSSQGRALLPTDFLPRRILGAYLRWCAERVLAAAPPNVTVQRHRAQAVDVDPSRQRVVLSDGSVLEAEDVFLTVGHASSDRGRQHPGASRWVANPSPLPGCLREVQPGETIAIRGFGLTAMDVLSSLTHGRGGRYESTDGGLSLRYVPSGREPRIVLFSRSGLPFRARPRVCSFGAPRPARVFSRARCAELRKGRPPRSVDFEADVLPLILTEMRLAYRECAAAQDGPEAREALQRRLDREGVEHTLAELDRERGIFDAQALLAPSFGSCLACSADYQHEVLRRVRVDLAEAEVGMAASPVKAALDVLREGRDAFRDAIDFGGLSDASRDRFYRDVVPCLNRAVVGPQFERHQELLALVQAGLLRIPLGPSPEVGWQEDARRWRLSSTRLDRPEVVEADWLCAAGVPPTTVAGPQASPLVRNLFERGLLRPCSPAGGHAPGAEVSARHHPIGRDGREQAGLRVLGPLCEGSIFYNHLVPSPDVWSRPIFEANGCVMEFYAL